MGRAAVHQQANPLVGTSARAAVATAGTGASFWLKLSFGRLLKRAPGRRRRSPGGPARRCRSRGPGSRSSTGPGLPGWCPLFTRCQHSPLLSWPFVVLGPGEPPLLPRPPRAPVDLLPGRLSHAPAVPGTSRRGPKRRLMPPFTRRAGPSEVAAVGTGGTLRNPGVVMRHLRRAAHDVAPGPLVTFATNGLVKLLTIDLGSL